MKKSPIIKSRKITEEEYKFMIAFLDKYKMDKRNFIKNSRELLINEIGNNTPIYNGYDSKNNILYYNQSSDAVREFLHVASSNGDNEQGICIRPNKVYKKPMGYGLNEGITDLFLEYATNKDGPFAFEKICAKVLEYAYGIDIYKSYFLSRDGIFRHQFNIDIHEFLLTLDEYCDTMITIKEKLISNKQILNGAISGIKIYIDLVIDKLLKITKNSNKKCEVYLKEQLKSETMAPIYNIIGEYTYKGELKK